MNFNTITMKTILSLSLFVSTLVILIVSACEPVDGDPVSDDPRDAYVGEWQFIESFKSTEGQSYLVTITKDPSNSSQILLANFGNPGSNDIYAVGLVTASQVVISQQKLVNSSWVVQGAGSFSNVSKTAMNWAFSITAGGSKDDYTATATKQ
jgi:hypothetical protein